MKLKMSYITIIMHLTIAQQDILAFRVNANEDEYGSTPLNTLQKNEHVY